jgi:hypothetical protein
MNTQYKNFLAPQILNTVLVFIVAFVVWFGSPFGSEPSVTLSVSPLSNYFMTLLQDFPWISRLVSFALVLVAAFLLVVLNNRHSIIRIQTFYPALFYVMIVGFLDNRSGLLSGGNIAALFILVSLSELLSISDNRDTGKVFNVFLLLSIASLFVFQLILLLPFLWIALVLLILPDLKTILASLIGLLLPYLFAIPIYFYVAENPDLFSLLQTKLSSFGLYSCNLMEGIYLLVLILVLLIAFVSFSLSSGRENIRTRKINYVFYILMFGSICITLLSGEDFADLNPVAALFIAMLSAHYFSFNYNWFSKTLLGIFILSGLSVFIYQFV